MVHHSCLGAQTLDLERTHGRSRGWVGSWMALVSPHSKRREPGEAQTDVDFRGSTSGSAALLATSNKPFDRYLIRLSSRSSFSVKCSK
jgi:hypothetical protein